MPKVRKIPQRMCVGCRQMKNKKDLIRVVRTPEMQIIVDKTGKKSGRGAYICASIECFNLAMKGKRLHKSLEHDIPDGLLEELKRELVEG